MAFGIKKFVSDLTGFSNTLKISPNMSISERWSVDVVLCVVFSQGILSVGDDKSRRDDPLLKIGLEDSVADLGDCPRTITDVYFSKT